MRTQYIHKTDELINYLDYYIIFINILYIFVLIILKFFEIFTWHFIKCHYHW